jgi:hypothetical protein
LLAGDDVVLELGIDLRLIGVARKTRKSVDAY